MTAVNYRQCRAATRGRYGYYLDNYVDCIAQLLPALGIGVTAPTKPIAFRWSALAWPAMRGPVWTAPRRSKG
jgi:hypothetical protein